MANIGDIRLFGGSTPPSGWHILDASIVSALVPVGNEGLTAILGQLLPDARSRTLIGLLLTPGGVALSGGVEQVTLGVDDIPAHSHTTDNASASANNDSTVTGHALATPGVSIYSNAAATASLAPATISIEGSGNPHSNIQPYLAVNPIICISGGLVPAAGASSGGSFSALGGIILLTAYFGIEPAKFKTADGSAVSRATFSGLFSLIGTTFGVGDGSTTFNLPDLTGKAVCGAGTGGYSGATAHTFGTTYGEDSHTLLVAELPAHSHDFNGVSGSGSDPSPINNYLSGAPIYQTTPGAASMSASQIGPVGQASPAHENRQPFMAVGMLIAVDDVVDDYNTGDIVIAAWTSAPTNWQLCDGSSLTTAGEPNLFAAVSYAFGGSGANFNVPDFRGQIPVGAGTGIGLATYAIGDTGGAESVALTTSTMPAHSHPVQAVAGSANSASPTGRLLAGGQTIYKPSGTLHAMDSGSVSTEGSGTAHENRMKTIAMNYFIRK